MLNTNESIHRNNESILNWVYEAFNLLGNDNGFNL